MRSARSVRLVSIFVVAVFVGLSATATPLASQPIPAPAGIRTTAFTGLVSFPETTVASASTAHLVVPEQSRCDGSGIRAASSRRGLGVIVGLAGVAISALAFDVTETTNTQFGPVVEQSVSLPRLGVGLATLGVGTYLYRGKKADSNAWDTALNSLTIGASTPAEVTTCLGKPRSTATSTSERGNASILTYFAKSQGINQMYKLTFANGVLANVEKTASK